MSTHIIKLVKKLRTFVASTPESNFSGICYILKKAWFEDKIYHDEYVTLRYIIKSFRPNGVNYTYYFPQGQKQIRLKYLDLIIEFYQAETFRDHDIIIDKINNLNRTFYEN